MRSFFFAVALLASAGCKADSLDALAEGAAPNKTLSCDPGATSCTLECTGQDDCVADCGSANSCSVTCSGSGSCECKGQSCQVDCRGTGECSCSAGICVMTSPACAAAGTAPTLPEPAASVSCGNDSCDLLCPSGQPCAAFSGNAPVFSVDATQASFAKVDVGNRGSGTVRCPAGASCVVSGGIGGDVDVECGTTGDCWVQGANATSLHVTCPVSGPCNVQAFQSTVTVECTSTTHDCVVSCANKDKCTCTGARCRTCG